MTLLSQSAGTCGAHYHEGVSANLDISQTVLVIDDEENLRHMLGVILKRAGYAVLEAGDGEAGLSSLNERGDIGIIICDVRMPKLDGLGFLDRLSESGSDAQTIVMSAYGSMELAFDAVRRGACDYVSKPFRADEILLALHKVGERKRLHREQQRLAEENRVLRQQVGVQEGMARFLGKSRAVQSLLATASKIAVYPTTVLITGESGTGKELLARGLHALSSVSEGSFVAVNCGAIPENLLESELFGHDRGAFTGAHKSRPGLFEQAHEGTLLLDELGELPLVLQVKLLRVLETQEVRRLGSTFGRKVSVRVLGATSKDLRGAVAKGVFREDLFYRLNVVHLEIPPLRERREDVPLLVTHFLTLHGERLGKPTPRLHPDTLRALSQAPWPGNVRQLENAVERALLLCDGGEITPDLLPPDVLNSPQVSEEASDLSIKRRTSILERDLIRRALSNTGGNRSQAARLLEISYKTLLYKIRDYGLGNEK